MREIEKAMVQAVNEHRNWRSGNTEVWVHDGGGKTSVYLHGNLIYYHNVEERDGNVVNFTLAGWNTPTTRSRLKALGINVCQRDCEPMFNGEVINKNEWYQTTKNPTS